MPWLLGQGGGRGEEEGERERGKARKESCGVDRNGRLSNIVL